MYPHHNTDNSGEEAVAMDYEYQPSAPAVSPEPPEPVEVPIVLTHEDMMRLQQAIMTNQTDVVVQFFQSGVHVNSLKDDQGNTPLHYAVVYGHLEMADLLLMYAADMHVNNHAGQTPASLATERATSDAQNPMIDLLRRYATPAPVEGDEEGYEYGSVPPTPLEEHPKPYPWK
jgi:hypothetical protein